MAYTTVDEPAGKEQTNTHEEMIDANMTKDYPGPESEMNTKRSAKVYPCHVYMYNNYTINLSVHGSAKH